MRQDSQLAFRRFAAFTVGVFLTLNARAATPADAFQRFNPVFDADGQLVVAAVVVTDRPYQADTTGKTDASAVIQRAMGDVSAHGGGTVFLPAGRYRLDKHVTVPATVTLCGQWRKPKPGQPLSGTVLLAYADKNDADAPALLSAPGCGHANVFNLSWLGRGLPTAPPCARKRPRGGKPHETCGRAFGGVGDPRRTRALVGAWSPDRAPRAARKPPGGGTPPGTCGRAFGGVGDPRRTRERGLTAIFCPFHPPRPRRHLSTVLSPDSFFLVTVPGVVVRKDEG
jgi:hypothetical protein